MRYYATSKGQCHEVVATRGDRGWRVRVDDREVSVDVLALGPSLYSLLIGGRSYEVDVLETEGALVVHVGGQPFRVELQQDRPGQSRPAAGGRAASSGQTITAPMPGKVVRLLVTPGELVRAGQGVAVIEAMKMENELKALADGRVRDVRGVEGTTVKAGEVLVVLEATGGDAEDRKT